MNDIVELLASSPSVMTVFVLDGFKISSEVEGDDNNNRGDTTDLGHLAHWRLETCLPEVRLTSGDVEPPSLKPVPPPKPANLKSALLDYKAAKGGLTEIVSLTNSDRDRPQKDGDSSRLQSKIPILKGSRLAVKTEKFPHKICLKIENSGVADNERSDGQHDHSLSSWSGLTTPASQIPRPSPSLGLQTRGSSSLMSLPMSGRTTPVRGWLGQSRDSLEVEFSQILMSQSSPHLVRCQHSSVWLLAGGHPGLVLIPAHYSGG